LARKHWPELPDGAAAIRVIVGYAGYADEDQLGTWNPP